MIVLIGLALYAGAAVALGLAMALALRPPPSADALQTTQDTKP
jgi:hypothetical protein